MDVKTLTINNPYIILAVIVIILIEVFLFLRKKKNKKTSYDKFPPFSLTRYENNPIILPTSHNPHEEIAAFNPSVIIGGDGNFHMLYRAIGGDGVSRFCYAVSSDGRNFDLRLPYPVMHLDETIYNPSLTKGYDFSLNPSGGSSFGLEDPRMTMLDGKVYVFANIFAGWGFMKVGLNSIKETDFINKRFKWSGTKIVSPDNERHKNWTLFPEKINGKYAILHGISPKVMIDYVDDISKPFTINSMRGEGVQPGRKSSWDSHVRSAGPAPLSTKYGWLVLYHANDSRETYKYKLGAMLLDKKDPTIITHRGDHPILEPDMHYENDGKPGIVYSCGAVIKDDKLFVYYGGGDKCCCVAETNINELLEWLIKQ